MSTIDLHVKVGDLRFHNPLLAASGTFGFGREMSRFFELDILGGVVTKGVTPKERLGNSPHRIAEARSGMLNAVGLQNPGIERVLREDLPWLLKQKTKVIVNAAGDDLDDYVELTKVLRGSGIDAIELNLSCPNVKTGCMAIGSEPFLIEQVTSACKAISDVPIWVKLTPNVTHIEDMAKAAEAGGADAISLINTLLGLRIDLRSRRPVLKNNTGGYSGPGIFPVALRMVQACYRAVNIPIVGLGGIMSAEDVVEMMLAGASAVQIGTATLLDPYAMPTMLDALPDVLASIGATRASEIVGEMKPWQEN